MNPMRKFRILIVCPEPGGLALLTSMLRSLGHLIEEAATDRLAVRLMERNSVNLVLASVDPGDADALELLSYVRRKHTGVPVILMFPRVHPDRAKEALRLGAMAVLKYPVPAAELRAAVLQALESWDTVPEEVPISTPTANLGAGQQSRSALTVPPYSESTAIEGGLSNGPRTSGAGANPMPAGPFTSGLPLPAMGPGAMGRSTPLSRTETLTRELDLITADPGLRQLVELAGTLASTSASVLIVGEPGTGKSLLAQLLHLGGGHPERPFVTFKSAEFVSNGTTDDHEGESAGMSDWSNRLNHSRGGTLHVKEVGALSPELQLQLLRELQIHDMEASAGHSRMQPRSDVRFVLSTSENLPALVEQGRFRQELYHRISTICLMVPPLAACEGPTSSCSPSISGPDSPRSSARTSSASPATPSRRSSTPRLAGQRPRAQRRDPARRGPLHRPADHSGHSRRSSTRTGQSAGPRDIRQAALAHGHPAAQGGPRGAREADHHPGPSGLELEPSGDRPGPRHQPHDPLQEDEEIRAAGR